VLALIIFAIIMFHGTILWPITQVFGLGYVILYLALHPGIQLPDMDRWGDFSYGLYIYAFPVQQLIIKYFTTEPVEVLIYTTLVTVPLAMVSWRYIEKPALKLKGRLPLGRRWLDPRIKKALTKESCGV